MRDEPLKRCPECRGKVKRLFGTGAGIIFKGSGFYETDYKRSKAAASAAKETASSESKTESSTTSKSSETKSTDS
jgi:predicted nucleic acid-binding Zn ribbon protein